LRSTDRYNAIGNRTTETKHAATGDTTRTYIYPTSGGPRPHALSSVAITGASTGTDSYGYDQTGNTTTRNIAGKPGQTLTWDNEGHLATVTDTGGNRLVAKDPTGATVYLGAFEVRRDNAGTVTATRYYYGGTAVRTTAAGLVWLATDHHSTGQLAISATNLAVVRRKTDPYGNPRGTDPAWPIVRGFVNGYRDPTGLTHLGAREYEPGAGRFVSVDAVLVVSDQQQVNGYSYAANNPTTASDPSGNRHDPDEPWQESVGEWFRDFWNVPHDTAAHAGPRRSATSTRGTATARKTQAHHLRGHCVPGVVVHAGDHLRLHPARQQHPADDVHLPQLHRLLALPPLVVLAPTAPLDRLDQPVAHQDPVHRHPGRHRPRAAMTGPARARSAGSASAGAPDAARTPPLPPPATPDANTTPAAH
jgi:RHS repeat-associated protein